MEERIIKEKTYDNMKSEITIFVSKLVSTFAHEIREIAHEASFFLLLMKQVSGKEFVPLLRKRVLTKRVFEHCSRNECSRNEFKTREQISLKDFLVRWNFQFSTCAPCSNIVHITNSQCSTIMITWFFVLGFLEVVTGDARLRRPQGLNLSLEPKGKISVVECFRMQSFCQCSYFSWLFFPSFSSYVATLKICSFVKNLNAHN